MIERIARTFVPALVAAVVVVPVDRALADVQPLPVLTTRAVERQPAAAEGVIAWVGRAHAYVRTDAEGPVRVNDVDTRGVPGAVSGSFVIYQQYSQLTGDSDIYLFDLETEERTRVGRPVGTQKWEYYPSMSGSWILFARWHPNWNREIVLYDTDTHDQRVIANSAGPRWTLIPTQVNGDYVAYESLRTDRKDRIVGCDVFRYQISTETTWAVPNRRGICQYGSSVTTTGLVYYGRSGMVCGHRAAIRAALPGVPWRRVVALPSGTDFGSSYALESGDGVTSVYFDWSECGHDSDVYVVNDDGNTNVAFAGLSSDSGPTHRQAVEVPDEAQPRPTAGSSPWRA